MLTHIIVLVVGFIAGALVFRNNAAKAEKIVQDGKNAADKAKELAKKVK
jgi:F0F1-type ATP synthase assembly protein I